MFTKIFRAIAGDNPIERGAADFGEMLRLVEGMLAEANEVYWGKTFTPAERTALYERDVQVNRLERQTRREVVMHLSGPTPGDVPYGLLLMSLVKDIERVGDYAENLAEVPATTHSPGTDRVLPPGPIVEELRHVSGSVMKLAQEASSVYLKSDRLRAQELTTEGRSMSKRCDKLVEAIARSGYESAVAVDLTLGTRFYKRINAHFLNLLSSVLMPLDKLDYYDEKSLNQ